MKKRFSNIFLVCLILAMSSTANATLVLRDAFQDAALSIDAWGGTDRSGVLQTDIADDSNILAAYLYSASVWSGGVSDVELNGTNLSPATDGTLLAPNANPASTYIYDVTSFLAPTIEGTWGLQDHTITESGDNDGEVLVVAYKNASTVGNTAIIMDGELSLGGDTTTLDFGSPYESGDLLMSLAISFSAGGSQYTNVSVNDRLLSSAAGGYDDGENLANGSLITAGGIGDDPSNPSDPTARNNDDELYNLALGNSLSPDPFIAMGDTSLTLTTNNPSYDDNVFGLFLTSTFTISQIDDIIIDDPEEPAPVPEPSTWALMIMGLAGLLTFNKFKKV